jgi:hypothetical protein
LGQKLRNSTTIVRAAKLGTAAIVFLLAAPVQAADDLPEGAAKETVMRVCTVCHDTDHFTTKRRTKDEWSDTVDTMAKRGAMATDEEFDAIVDYLTKNFGKDKPAKDEAAK